MSVKQGRAGCFYWHTEPRTGLVEPTVNKKTIFKHITFIQIDFRYPVLCPCNDDITWKGALEIVLYTYFLHYCAKLVFKSLRNKVATLQWKITASSRTALIQVQCKVNAERAICQYNLGSQVSKIITWKLFKWSTKYNIYSQNTVE